MMELLIDGTEVSRDKLKVFCNDEPVLLTPKSFKFLFKLVAQRNLDLKHTSVGTAVSKGWLHKEKLEPGDNSTRYIYNLRRELGSYGHWIENDRRGSYRLALKAKQIGFTSNVATVDDCEIQAILKRIDSRIGVNI